MIWRSILIYLSACRSHAFLSLMDVRNCTPFLKTRWRLDKSYLIYSSCAFLFPIFFFQTGLMPCWIWGNSSSSRVFFAQVCREYQRGNCSRGENDCRFAHPADSTMIDTNDNTVTVCMDYIKGRCSREKCKYFHPPAHLQAKIKAAQHQVNQATAAAAMVSNP